jgi:hypothetical protein
MRERSLSFKQALNEAVRAGLGSDKRKTSRKFVQQSFRMGESQEFRWDKAMAVAASLEDEELTRKLSVRK